jgi:two-component system, chemotaxis family, response regulator Rcp1
VTGCARSSGARSAFSIQRPSRALAGIPRLCAVVYPSKFSHAGYCVYTEAGIDVHVEDMDVLLVEDNPGDIRLAQEAFAASKRPINIHVVRDGVDAMAFLQKEGAYVRAPRPHLILLDLNLPKMNGREVLVKIKTDASLKSIPTIILTSSELEADLQTSYENSANCYVTKPKDFETFVDFVRAMETLWFVLTSEPESVPNVSAPAESFA